MLSLVHNEMNFYVSCYKMARSNVILAITYIKDSIQNNSIYSKNNFPVSISLSLKERSVKLLKASGLLVRAPLLCLPLVNRATQLALRFLSPDLSIGSNFPEEEFPIRYSQEKISERDSLILREIQEVQALFKKIRLGDLWKMGLSNENIKSIYEKDLGKITQFKKGKGLEKLLSAYNLS